MVQDKILTSQVPDVSVIIPLYNTGAYIEDTLNSILGQTLRNLEIIVINDGSTDNGPEIITKLAEKDLRIQIYSQKNQGQSIARNAGIAKATGRYIYFMDSDDILEADALEMCLYKCEQEKLDFVFFDADILNKKNDYALSLSYQRTSFVNEKQTYSGIEMLNIQLDKWGFSASPCLSFIRKSYLDNIKLTFFPGIIHEDELFTALLYLQAQRIGCIARTFFKRRLRDDSTMTRRFAWKNMNGYFTVTEQLQKFSREKMPETRPLVDRFLSRMLDAAVYLAHTLSFRERLKIFRICFGRYSSYISLKTYIILFVKPLYKN